MASTVAVLTSNASCAALSQSVGALRDPTCKRVAQAVSARAFSQSRFEVQTAVEKIGWKVAPVDQIRISRMSEPVQNRAPQAHVGIAPETLQAVEAVTASTDGNGKAEVEQAEERCFAGTEYVPIYVMLPLNTVDESNQLHNPEQLEKDFAALKSVGVDGVMCDVWWGLVERAGPGQYDWRGYQELFKQVAHAGLKLQVVMSFHQCGGNVGDDTDIPIPPWVHEIAKENPDIFFTNRKGERNPECLSWGIDKERVLRGRTGLEVYYDFMRSFRSAMDEYFAKDIITEVEVGLGACGELRYPSYPERHGWKYPGIGEFQCYDKYMMAKLTKAAEARNHPDWAHGPEDAGEYNSQPQDTGFFRDGGNFDSYYGRWFLKWYSQQLIEHGDRVLHLADMVFEGTKIAAKVSGIHWWYKTASHAAELCAGFYNPHNRDGYAPIADMLARHNAAFNFTCVELITTAQEDAFPEAMADPEGLVWQVLNSAWDAGIPVASENALPCYDRQGYNKILENAKPRKDPDGRCLAAFTYLRLNPTLMEEQNFKEFARFVKRLHGEAVDDLNT